MKIGVLSDTHSREIPAQLLNDFKSVDLIIHAGDFCGLREYKRITEIKEIKAVYGNMDELNLRQILPEQTSITCDGVVIGIFHGEGPRARILDSVKGRFVKQKVDVIVFGHSHQPFNEIIDGVLYFNPGSPNDKVTAPYCSYGMLEINNGKVVGKIIKVQETVKGK